MNWSRGLFRAWVLLSVVWVGIVLVATWLLLPQEATVLLPHSNPNDPLADIVTDRWTTVNLTAWEGIMAIHPAAVAASALMPPTVFWAIGWVDLWIGRGFRRG
jgi:hypothetical protein